MPKKVMIFDLRHPAQFTATGREIYRAALDMCRWADERGFARIGLGEPATRQVACALDTPVAPVAASTRNRP